MPYYNVNAITEDGEVVSVAVAYSPEEIENRKKRKQAQEEYENKMQYRKIANKENGEFVFLIYNISEALAFGIQPATLTRLIYLSTYMGFDNRLRLTDVTSMQQKDIKDVLKISQSTYERFMEEVLEKKIIFKDEKERLYLDARFFFRGSVPKEIKNSFDKNVIKVYYNSVRQIYEKAKVTEHARLSYLFQMIPFVNIQYNMLCHNPLETEMKYVKAMTLPEYCSIVGYSPENAHKLKSFLKKVLLDDIPVFSFVDNNYGLFCYVNPNIFYVGNSEDKVEILKSFKKEN